MARRKYRHSKKNILKQSVDFAKSTSKKYMPKVKTNLENVGSNVIKTGEQSVPFLQKMTRKFFNMFSFGKTRKRRS